MIKWTVVLAALSLCAGSLSALFLYLLNAVTITRENNIWLLYMLPFVGVFIVWGYSRYGGEAQKGNELLFYRYYNPGEPIPFRMAPMVILGTLLTHLFGGSAGREGTAIQYGGTIADQFSKYIEFSKQQKRILLLCGIAAGFSSLFGTPVAGSIFALEFVKKGKFRWYALPLILLSSFLATWICNQYGDLHTHYQHIKEVLPFDLRLLMYLAIAGLIFGLASRLFFHINDYIDWLFKQIKQPLVRPFVAGILIIVLVSLLQTTKHIGLGIPVILDSFIQTANPSDFLIKMLLTSITLCAGFKGGEVTPLFFIGATLGSALSPYIPLPLTLLAATGLVGVFAGCTKTPIGCTLMAMELFGWENGHYFLLICGISFLISGSKGIYRTQKNSHLFGVR